MLDPISLTVASLQNDMRRLDVVSNNAANALTPGFKRKFAAISGESAVATAGIPGNGDLLATAPIQTFVSDLKAAPPKRTGNPLDLALLGEGYLEVRTAQGVAYTRVGALHLDERGRLVSQSGDPVMGLSGDIVPGTPNPVVDRDGRIFDKDKLVGQIKVVMFEHPAKLLDVGGGLFAPAPGQTPVSAERPRILQGQLENSNVDSAREMISLVETFRHFEGGNRVLQAYDEMRDKTFRALGQF